MLAYVCGGAAIVGLLFTITLLPRQAPEDHYSQLEPEPEPDHVSYLKELLNL